jgi:integrase
VHDEQRYLTEDEVEALVEEMPDRYKPLTYMGAYLGPRWQEIGGLRRSNLDMRPRRLATVRIVTTIERANNRYAVVEYGKTEADDEL